ncbi:FAD:protein FMN transferase [Nonomuraea gerenzanensis]|uniref:FAD:protein FMN transferase n=1 Tax=Nonomuraea gerenzanensis TaxID=93944 RepID=A0A1M4E8C5_9ACTN|nr:FAD:protein FMN transferase [Nonomuraea gerenzanensis]UBU17371.1 FAD:protein FMN transferase [Nonomuraea gerenzanensis]SBO95121.1 Thiamin biosynthesis lipoprotein ApbE [Nonomuraea gerenzanensis]
MTVRALRDRVMGTDLLLVLPPQAQAAVLEWLRAVERTFSRFDPGSDTSRVNAGGAVVVSELFLTALDEACRYFDATGGLFNPFLGAELARLGYDTDFALVGTRDVGATTSPAGASDVAAAFPVGASDVAAAAAPGGAPVVHLDHDRRAVTLSPGLAVDLGGFVKGWSVQRAAEAERDSGRVPYGMIDAGGDLVAWRPDDGRPWRIGVEHPLRERPVGVLELPMPTTAVATSSVVRRRWRDRAGAELHHLIDPRTGEPADSDCAQATVITADLAAAEVYATCLVLLGTREGPRWLAGQAPGAGWITVGRDGRVRSSVALV